MRITTKGLYAVEILAAMAGSSAGRSWPIQRIARQTGIPYDYAEKLLLQLKTAGIVESARGARGGYRLARMPQSLTLEEIFRAVREGMTPWTSLPHFSKSRPLVCPLHPIWQKLYKHLAAFLHTTTLQDFVAALPPGKRGA